MKLKLLRKYRPNQYLSNDTKQHPPFFSLDSTFNSEMNNTADPDNLKIYSKSIGTLYVESKGSRILLTTRMQISYVCRVYRVLGAIFILILLSLYKFSTMPMKL